MEAIPWGFKSPLSHCIIFLVMHAACTPDLMREASALKARLEAPNFSPESFENFLEAKSFQFVRDGSFRGGLSGLLYSLRQMIALAQPCGQEPGLLCREEPSETLFFVRDGQKFRLDLLLSGALFSDLHSLRYPKPW